MKTPGLILSLCLLFSALCSAGVRPVDPAQGLVLENRLVRFEFEPKTLGLAAMIDRERKINHIHPAAGKQLLWEVAFAKGALIERVTNVKTPCSKAWIEDLPNGVQRAVLEWNDQIFWLEKGALTVHATVELPPDSGIAKWRIYVGNRSDYWGLWTVSYPLVNGFPEEGKYDLARPVFASGGHLLKAWSGELQARYPSGGWPMQFLALDRGGASVYLGTEDPDARAKDFLLKTGESGRAGIVHYVENMGERGSNYPDYYATAFGVHTGGWVRSALYYREWALRQKWASAGPLSRRTDMPEKIKNVGLWMRDDWLWRKADGTPQQQNAPLLEAAKWLGVPVAMHWYSWHKTLFDNNYPHYFPTEPGFRERVKELTSKDLLIMPYINGSSADMNIPDWEKFAPHAILDEGGGFRMHWYSDTAGRLLTMCSSSRFWQETIAGIVDRLVSEEGVNAVYVDQISAMEHELCFNRQHHHPMGGGRYWVDGYRDELRMIRNAAQGKARNAVITSEGADEVFFDLLDGNLTWAEATDVEIPLMPVVYSGYTLFIGSRLNYRGGQRLFNFAQGQAFIDGRQNGWMDLGLMAPEHKAKAEYFRECGRYHIAARDFVTYGRLWGPLEPLRPVPSFQEAGFARGDAYVTATVPSAEARLWQAEDGRLAVLFASYVDEPVNFTWKLNPQDYGVRAGSVQLSELTPQGSKPAGSAPGVIERIEKLPPRALKIVVIRGAEAPK